MTGKKKCGFCKFDIFTNYGRMKKNFISEDSPRSQVFWAKFGLTPKPPKPTNQKMAKFGFLKKRDFCIVTRKLALEAEITLSTIQDFFYRVKLLNKKIFGKNVFWSHHYPKVHFDSKVAKNLGTQYTSQAQKSHLRVSGRQALLGKGTPRGIFEVHQVSWSYLLTYF